MPRVAPLARVGACIKACAVHGSRLFFACKVLKSPRLKRFSSLFVLAISVDIRRKLAIATVASVQWNLKLFNKKA